MLQIKANKSIYIDGEKLDIGNSSMKDFLISSLNCKVALDNDLVLGDLFHILYDIREFICLYSCEEYEVGRALVNAGKFAEGYDYLKIFKNAEVTSDGFLDINIQSELESHGEVGRIQNVCDLKIVLDEKIIDGDEILRKDVELRADFTLLELIEVLYEDFLYTLKKGNVLI